MNNEKSVDSKSKIINIALFVIAFLIFVSGGYVLFFKNKDNNRQTSDDSIMQQFDKVEFTNKVVGQSGDLYLDQNGRVYFVLSDYLKDDKTLMSFVRTFKTIKNAVYGYSQINAILLNTLDVMRINYIAEDTVQDSYYLLTMSGGKQMLIYDYEIMGKQIINIVENVEHNAKVDEFNGVYLARLGDGNGADIEAIIGEEKTDDILIGIKQGSLSIYRKKDGKNYIRENDGTEKEITSEVANNLNETIKGYIKTLNDYSDKTYGKNMENLPPENKIVKLNDQASKNILDKYGVIKTKDYMDKKNITLDRVVNNEIRMPSMCNCMGYSGFKDEDYNICRDVTGIACWTPDEGYINPYLRPTIDEKTGLYSTDTRIDISYTAEHNDKQNAKKIQDAVKSGTDKWWVYINGKLTVADPNKDLSKSDTGLYRDRLTGEIAGFECYGSAEECKNQLKSHVQAGDLDNTTIEDVDNLFETGHKKNYVDPKDYHATDVVGNDKTPTPTGQNGNTQQPLTCEESCNRAAPNGVAHERCLESCNKAKGTSTPTPTSTSEVASCVDRCTKSGGPKEGCIEKCSESSSVPKTTATPKSTVSPTPSAAPKPTPSSSAKSCDDSCNSISNETSRQKCLEQCNGSKRN